MAIDPVCGMEVDEASVTDRASHEGQTYYFCSADCKEEFETAPEEYLGGDELATGT